ncbi:MAG TPA: hypothetical protein VJ672_10650 [Gemmatimonadaceae bacterium]|nr:hypothetical protein [Gemmatimonadaceae bacterium]
MLDPRLMRLRSELERLGSVVVPHGSHICVRLPLAASVVVRLENGVLRCHPQLGPFGRATALGGTAVATTAGVVALLATGGLALPIAAAVGGVSAMMVELGGFVTAENCVTRVQTLWARIDADIGTLPVSPNENRALQPPLPDELARAPRPADLHVDRPT